MRMLFRTSAGTFFPEGTTSSRARRGSMARYASTGCRDKHGRRTEWGAPAGRRGGNGRRRSPHDPAWSRGGLYHDDMKLNVPGLWFMSWYDVSVGPNLALYNHVRHAASPEVGNEQWAIIAPVAHCAYMRATEDTIVGERSM